MNVTVSSGTDEHGHVSMALPPALAMMSVRFSMYLMVNVGLANIDAIITLLISRMFWHVLATACMNVKWMFSLILSSSACRLADRRVEETGPSLYHRLAPRRILFGLISAITL